MIDCRLNNRRIVFGSLCTICAKLSSISLISYFVLCNFWLEIVAKQYAPRSVGWECLKEISHTIESFVCFGFFAYLDFWFCACEKLRKFAHRSINEWLYRNCDRCDRSMNRMTVCLSRHASPPLRAGGLLSDEWNKYANLRILLTICMCFSLFVWYFLMISDIFESEFN